MNEVEQKKQQAQELILTIRPLLQMNIEKLLTDRVDKLLGTVNRQDSKLEKIADVLQSIYTIKSQSVGGGMGAHLLGPSTPTPEASRPQVWSPLKQQLSGPLTALDIQVR